MHSPLKISSKSLYEKGRKDVRVLLQSLLINRLSNEAISEGRIGNSTGPKLQKKDVIKREKRNLIQNQKV